MQYSILPPGGHQLPPLPYPYNALEPVISATALRFHHDQHHQSYVEGLNKAELKLVAARQKRDFSLIKHWERELAFHGSGHILHSIYWTGMAPPDSCGQPGTFTQKLVQASHKQQQTNSHHRHSRHQPVNRQMPFTIFPGGR
jgi:Fe-Mn family superoxide dismutase